MAKRFTATGKWADPWFCDLPNVMKLFWVFLLDNCNHAGVWEPNWPLVEFHLRVKFKTLELDWIRKRIQLLNSGKWFIPKFIEFQYGTLQKENRAHQSVISLLEKEGLCMPLVSPLQGDKDKDKDKDMESLVVKDFEPSDNVAIEAVVVESEELPTPEKLVIFWNETRHPALPAVKELTPKRKIHILQRLKDHPDKDFWIALIEKVNKSPLLTGQKGDWKCSFDWVLNQNNLAKILEGNYDKNGH